MLIQKYQQGGAGCRRAEKQGGGGKFIADAFQQGGVLLDGEKVTDPTMTVSAEALAAGVLILYPRYYDWFTGQFCRPEDVCWRLEHLVHRPHDSLWVNAVRGAYSLKRRAFRFFQGVFEIMDFT